MSTETRVDEVREQIANRLGDPDRLRFPDGWTTSSSWKRAQAAPSNVGPVNPAEFDVLLGYIDEDGLAKHRVLFALYEGDLVAECECDGHRFRSWCAHVALLLHLVQDQRREADRERHEERSRSDRATATAVADSYGDLYGGSIGSWDFSPIAEQVEKTAEYDD